MKRSGIQKQVLLLAIFKRIYNKSAPKIRWRKKKIETYFLIFKIIVQKVPDMIQNKISITNLQYIFLLFVNMNRFSTKPHANALQGPYLHPNNISKGPGELHFMDGKMMNLVHQNITPIPQQRAPLNVSYKVGHTEKIVQNKNARKKVNINLNIKVNKDGKVGAGSKNFMNPYQGPQNPVMLQPQLSMNHPLFVHPRQNIIPKFPVYQVLQKEKIMTENLDQQREEKSSVSYDSTIEQEKIHCVICDQIYPFSEKDEHIQKHHKRKHENNKIKAVTKDYSFDKEPKARPIVEPKEFNVEYHPSLYILQHSKENKKIHEEEPVQLGIGTEQTTKPQRIQFGNEGSQISQIPIENYQNHGKNRKEREQGSFYPQQKIKPEVVQFNEMNGSVQKISANETEKYKTMRRGKEGTQFYPERKEQVNQVNESSNVRFVRESQNEDVLEEQPLRINLAENRQSLQSSANMNFSRTQRIIIDEDMNQVLQNDKSSFRTSLSARKYYANQYSEANPSAYHKPPAENIDLLEDEFALDSKEQNHRPSLISRKYDPALYEKMQKQSKVQIRMNENQQYSLQDQSSYKESTHQRNYEGENYMKPKQITHEVVQLENEEMSYDAIEREKLESSVRKRLYNSEKYQEVQPSRKKLSINEGEIHQMEALHSSKSLAHDRKYTAANYNQAPPNYQENISVEEQDYDDGKFLSGVPKNSARRSRVYESNKYHEIPENKASVVLIEGQNYADCDSPKKKSSSHQRYYLVNNYSSMPFQEVVEVDGDEQFDPSLAFQQNKKSGSKREFISSKYEYRPPSKQVIEMNENQIYDGEVENDQRKSQHIRNYQKGNFEQNYKESVILNEDFEDSRPLDVSQYRKSGSKRDFISSKYEYRPPSKQVINVNEREVYDEEIESDNRNSKHVRNYQKGNFEQNYKESVILNEDFEDSRVLETSDYKKSGSKRDFISSKYEYRPPSKQVIEMNEREIYQQRDDDQRNSMHVRNYQQRNFEENYKESVFLNEDFADSQPLDTSYYRKSSQSRRKYEASTYRERPYSSNQIFLERECQDDFDIQNKKSSAHMRRYNPQAYSQLPPEQKQLISIEEQEIQDGEILNSSKFRKSAARIRKYEAQKYSGSPLKKSAFSLNEAQQCYVDEQKQKRLSKHTRNYASKSYNQLPPSQRQIIEVREEDSEDVESSRLKNSALHQRYYHGENYDKKSQKQKIFLNDSEIYERNDGEESFKRQSTHKRVYNQQKYVPQKMKELIQIDEIDKSSDREVDKSKYRKTYKRVYEADQYNKNYKSLVDLHDKSEEQVVQEQKSKHQRQFLESNYNLPQKNYREEVRLNEREEQKIEKFDESAFKKSATKSRVYQSNDYNKPPKSYKQVVRIEKFEEEDEIKQRQTISYRRQYSPEKYQKMNYRERVDFQEKQEEEIEKIMSRSKNERKYDSSKYGKDPNQLVQIYEEEEDIDESRKLSRHQRNYERRHVYSVIQSEPQQRKERSEISSRKQTSPVRNSRNRMTSVENIMNQSESRSQNNPPLSYDSRVSVYQSQKPIQIFQESQKPNEMINMFRKKRIPKIVMNGWA